MARSRVAAPKAPADSAGLSFADVIEDFLKYIQFEQGLTTTTQHSYGCYLRRFEKWLDGNGYKNASLSAFNSHVLRRYLHCISAGLRPRSIRSAFHPLRALSVYLVEMETFGEQGDVLIREYVERRLGGATGQQITLWLLRLGLKEDDPRLLRGAVAGLAVRASANAGGEGVDLLPSPCT